MLPGTIRSKRFGTLLWLVLLSGQCFVTASADLLVESLTQSPANPVVAGNEVIFTITVRNPDAATFVNFDILASGVSVAALFDNPDGQCSLDGIFFCDQLVQDGVQAYSFRTTATLQGFPAPIEFLVGCSGVGCEGPLVQVNPVTQIVPRCCSIRRFTCVVNSLTVRIRLVSSVGNSSPNSH